MEWKTSVTELFGIKYPIIQGGLAYLAYADLCVAVSEAGGLGQITAMSLGTPGALRAEIQKVKTMTDKPFGVNFAISRHGRPFSDMLDVALEEGVKIMSVTGGNPAPFFEQLKGKGVKTLVLVAAKRQAEKAEELGADAVMVVGQEGGGHLGRDDIGTMVLTPLVADAVSIPVIASGGIGDGRGWMAAHALGADGVEMGTRFIATKECVHASKAYLEALLASNETGTTVIKRTIGAPARALTGPWTEKIIELEAESADYEKLKDFISGDANRKFIHDGDIENGYGWAGQVAGLIEDVPTVAELLERMVEEAETIRNGWGFDKKKEELLVEYNYPLRSDWSTEEIITVVGFYELIEKTYEDGVAQEKLMDAYRLFKAIIPSKSEEKAIFKEFEEVSGHDSYRIVKLAKESVTGELIKGT